MICIGIDPGTSAVKIIAAAAPGVRYTVTCSGANYAEPPALDSPLAVGYAWASCLAILGGAYRRANVRTRFTSFMSKRSFGLYVFHYLPLSAAAPLLRGSTDLPPAACCVIVFVAAYAGGYLLNEIISRVPFLRFAVLGVKNPAKNKAASV